MLCGASSEEEYCHGYDWNEVMSEGAYTRPGRLQDVLALIQVLSLDDSAHRSESGLFRELQVKPTSSDSWMTLASEHPEFFRVAGGDKWQVSLVARHVLPRGDDGTRKFPSDFVQLLLQTAIELHDRQMKVAENWKSLIPIWAALIASVVTLLSVWLKRN
jgi:hypothetical protein